MAKTEIITVRMNYEDTNLIREFAKFHGKTISEFARETMLKAIQDEYDLQELKLAIAEDNGIYHTMDEVADEFL